MTRRKRTEKAERERDERVLAEPHPDPEVTRLRKLLLDRRKASTPNFDTLMDEADPVASQGEAGWEEFWRWVEREGL